MKFKPKNLKGTRDYSPLEATKREYMKQTFKNIFRRFAYQPIETPAIEKREFLEGLYGHEAETLIFKILNSGQKIRSADINAFKTGDYQNFVSSLSDKALRYDLTVPLSRYVAQHQNEITFPFKRYQIQNVWRADRPQHGRLQEFVQCDVDVIGQKSILQEVEMLLIIASVVDALRIDDLEVRINHRGILESIIEYLGESEKFTEIVTVLDKLEKIGMDGIRKELTVIGLKEEKINNLKNFITTDLLKDFALSIFDDLKKSPAYQSAFAEVNKVLKIFNQLNKSKLTISFDSKLARGLNYYTGMVVEVVHKEEEYKKIGSLIAGGRYDNLTGKFGLHDKSGIGISFGFERIFILMNQLNSFNSINAPKPKVLFLNFGEPYSLIALELVNQLRDNGVSTDLYPGTIKIKRQLDYANKLSIPYVVLFGSEEDAKNVFLLRDMNSREQVAYTNEKLVEFLTAKIS